MDSRNKDEARDRRREEALARRVGDALDQLAHAPVGECPDAEVIAAYNEKSLQPDEIARRENHFAICGRCRKILAVLAAAVEAPLAEKEVAHLGELTANTRAPAQAAARPIVRARPSRLARHTRWLAPALGVAAVLAVWFAMRPPPWRTADPNPSGMLIAQAPKSEPPPNTEARAQGQASESIPTKDSDADAKALKARPETKPQFPGPPADALAKDRLEDGRVIGRLVPSPDVAKGVLRDENKQKAETYNSPSSNSVGGAFSASAPAPPPVVALPKSAPASPRETQAQAVQKAPQLKAPSPAASQSEAMGDATRQSEAAPVSQDNSRSRANKASPSPQQETSLALNRRNYTVLLKSQSGRVLWAAGPRGSIRHSSDGGRTWDEQTSPFGEDWEAGALISDTICWLVGDRGAIARTADGLHWEKILPPASGVDTTGAFLDWVGITATSPQEAIIEARDGRRYLTQDGGKTWRAQ